MNKIQGLALTLACLILSPSCSKKAASTVDPEIAKFNGTWTLCTQKGTDGADSPEYKNAFVLKDGESTQSLVLYTSEDGSCTGTQLAILAIKGKAVKGAGTSAVEGATLLDVTSTSATVTALDASGKAYVTSCAGVADGDVVVGTAYNINSTECANLPGTTEYTIAKIDTAATPNALYLGQSDAEGNDGTTAEKRYRVLIATPLLKQ